MVRIFLVPPSAPDHHLMKEELVAERGSGKKKEGTNSLETFGFGFARCWAGHRVNSSLA